MCRMVEVGDEISEFVQDVDGGKEERVWGVDASRWVISGIFGTLDIFCVDGDACFS